MGALARACLLARLAHSVALARDRSKTVREIIASGGGAHRLVVGTPTQIADTIEDWFETRAADGFNIMSDIYPSGLHLEAMATNMARERVRRAELGLALLRRHVNQAGPAVPAGGHGDRATELTMSPVGAPDAPGIPVEVR